MSISKNQAIVQGSSMSFYRGQRCILNNISFSIPEGKLTGIMGTSGCGKTTLLRLISGQLLPETGDISVFNQSLLSLSKKQLYAMRQDMSILFQSGALFTDLSVYENVAFPLLERNMVNVEDKVMAALQSVGLAAAKDLSITSLSGGMMRRVAFARATVIEPKILMLDEPFAGQDPIAKGVLVKLISEIKQKSTCLLVSHDITETLELADHLIVLHGGDVIAQGSVDEITKNPSPMVQQFLHGDPNGPVSFHMPSRTNNEGQYA